MTALESVSGLTDPTTLHSKGRVLFDLLVFKKKGRLEVFSLHSPTGKVEHTRLVFALNALLESYSGLLQENATACARVMDLGGEATVHFFERVGTYGPDSFFELRAAFQLGEVPEIVDSKAVRRESLLAKMYREGRFD